ncbi:MAG TPA: DUF4382 domain-containing protein, partial [Pseudomonadales bacterium]|nr:DUF4382 domain-containing protein [Pseudomonadales bacterium]
MNNSGGYKKAILATLIASLVGCGGGGGGSSSPSSSDGSISFQVTDGPGSDFDHVWVTIKAIAIHADDNAAKSDSNWYTSTLPSPVTIDLAQLNNGALSSVLSTISLPAGTYRQIRFYLAGADESLTDSALAIKDTETPAQALQWNDQVEYTDSSGNILESPLEIAYPSQGIQFNGTFTVTAGNTLKLAVDFDLDHDVVPFNHGAVNGFTLRPNLRYFDLAQAGAIVGQVDPASLCPVDGRGVPTTNANCTFDLVVKAELLGSAGLRHYDARATMVNPQTGKFILYPL